MGVYSLDGLIDLGPLPILIAVVAGWGSGEAGNGRLGGADRIAGGVFSPIASVIQVQAVDVVGRSNVVENVDEMVVGKG